MSLAKPKSELTTQKLQLQKRNATNSKARCKNARGKTLVKDRELPLYLHIFHSILFLHTNIYMQIYNC